MGQLTLKLLLASALTITTSAHNVTVKVKGQLICLDKPNLQVYMELREVDKNMPDDTLAWKFVPVMQPFEIEGSHDEWFGIIPYLRILHMCRELSSNLCYLRLGKFGINARSFFGSGAPQKPKADLESAFEDASKKYKETIIVRFGERTSDTTIDIGKQDLGDKATKAWVRNRFRI